MNKQKGPILSVQILNMILKHSKQCQTKNASLFTFITSFLYQEKTYGGMTQNLTVFFKSKSDL